MRTKLVRKEIYKGVKEEEEEEGRGMDVVKVKVTRMRAADRERYRGKGKKRCGAGNVVAKCNHSEFYGVMQI